MEFHKVQSRDHVGFSYINELLERSETSKTDLLLIIHQLYLSKSKLITKRLALDLGSMNAWFALNKLKVNVSKCFIIPFGETIAQMETDEHEGLARETAIADNFK